MKECVSTEQGANVILEGKDAIPGQEKIKELLSW